MFCTECGTRNTADSKYCKECGGKVNAGYRTMMLSVDDLAAVDDAPQNQERLKKLLDMAFWHNQAGNLDAAVLASEAALVIHPNSTTAHSLLGTLYEKLGKDDKAIEHFEAVVSLNPDSAADAAKLEQVRRGVHVKAVAQPLAYKWLPPALMGLTWEKSKAAPRVARPAKAGLPAWPERWPKPSPLVASCAAGVFILTLGLLILHSSQTANATGPERGVSTPAVPVTVIASSAYGGASSTTPTGQTSLPAPVILKGGSASVPLNPPIAAASADPFSETLPPGTPTIPLVRPRSVGHAVRVGEAASVVKKHGSAPALPPLTLRAVPLDGDGGGLAPAPVSLPPSVSMASMPQHTVVVSNLGSVPSPQTASMTTSNGNNPNALASHIRITINSSPSPVSDHADMPRSQNGNSTGADGDSYQQSALSLQQQGDYRRAQAAYQKAIRAYKSQIASGRDADAATQGLAASQTGLQICQQSQQ